MEILLGIFHTNTFQDVYFKNNQMIAFPFEEAYIQNRSLSVLERVVEVSELAAKIHFVLDGIKLPLDCDQSVTCLELITILSDSYLLSKTQFWVYGEQIDTSFVIKVIQQAGHGHFNNVSLETALTTLKK